MDYNQKYLDIVKRELIRLTKDTDAVIYLFGSRASGVYHQGSDIDIGIEGLQSDAFFKLRNRFIDFLDDSIVPSDVDIVNFSESDESFVKTAKKGAKLWKSA